MCVVFVFNYFSLRTKMNVIYTYTKINGLNGHRSNTEKKSTLIKRDIRYLYSGIQILEFLLSVQNYL